MFLEHGEFQKLHRNDIHLGGVVHLIKSGYIKILDSEFSIISDEDIENLNDMYWEEEDEIKMGTHPTQVSYNKDNFNR